MYFRSIEGREWGHVYRQEKVRIALILSLHSLSHVSPTKSIMCRLTRSLKAYFLELRRPSDRFKGFELVNSLFVLQHGRVAIRNSIHRIRI